VDRTIWRGSNDFYDYIDKHVHDDHHHYFHHHDDDRSNCRSDSTGK